MSSKSEAAPSTLFHQDVVELRTAKGRDVARTYVAERWKQLFGEPMPAEITLRRATERVYYRLVSLERPSFSPDMQRRMQAAEGKGPGLTPDEEHLHHLAEMADGERAQESNMAKAKKVAAPAKKAAKESAQPTRATAMVNGTAYTGAQLLRYAGHKGMKPVQAERLLAHYGVEMKPSSLLTCLSDGRSGKWGAIPNLTQAQAAEVKRVAGEPGETTQADPKPTKPAKPGKSTKPSKPTKPAKPGKSTKVVDTEGAPVAAKKRMPARVAAAPASTASA